jgi:succinate dehydrogenase flavin-adding protein (antitoxin of CptAB toxin-antitoxin module)
MEKILIDLGSASGSQTDDADIRHRRRLFSSWHRGTQEIDLI